MVKLEADYLQLSGETDKLIDLLSNINSLHPKYAKIVSEILLLRLFDSLKETITSIAVKISCGALYVDGSQPNLVVLSKSGQDAINNMMRYGRKKPRYRLQWSQVKEIKKNVRYIIEPNEHFLNELDRHALFIEELRWIRNKIAHNTTVGTRTNYQKAVLRYYGGYVNSVTPGTLLLSPRQKPVLIEQYLKKARILVKTLIKG